MLAKNTRKCSGSSSFVSVCMMLLFRKLFGFSELVLAQLNSTIIVKPGISVLSSQTSPTNFTTHLSEFIPIPFLPYLFGVFQ